MSRPSTSRTTTRTRNPTRPWLVAAATILALAAVATGALLVRGTASAGPLTTIDVAALHELVQDDATGDAITLLDVREPHEYRAGHVEGALLLPLANTVALAEAEGFAKDEPIYVVCRTGNRSLQASRALVEAGYRDVRNVEGGMVAWQAAGYPVAR